MKVFLSFIFCLLFSVAVVAQQPTQIDEFGIVHCDEYLMRMDGAIAQADRNPTAKIFILIYEGKEQRLGRIKKSHAALSAIGSAKAKIKSMKAYIATRRIPLERFSFVDAGFRESFTVEIWLVPNGTLPPEPSPTLKKINYRKGKPTGFCVSCCG